MKLVRHKSVTYHLVDGPKTIGKVALIPTGGGWYLADFLIYKKYRGQGFGHVLMAKIMGLARRRGKKSMFLWVATKNTKAIKIYQKYFRCQIDDEGWQFYTWFADKKKHKSQKKISFRFKVAI